LLTDGDDDVKYYSRVQLLNKILCRHCGEQFNNQRDLCKHVIECVNPKTRSSDDEKTKLRNLFSIGLIPKELISSTHASFPSTSNNTLTDIKVEHNLPLNSVVSVGLTTPLGRQLLHGAKVKTLSQNQQIHTWSQLEAHALGQYSRHKIIPPEELQVNQEYKTKTDAYRQLKVTKFNPVTLHTSMAEYKGNMKRWHKQRHTQLRLMKECRPCYVRVTSPGMLKLRETLCQIRPQLTKTDSPLHMAHEENSNLHRNNGRKRQHKAPIDIHIYIENLLGVNNKKQHASAEVENKDAHTSRSKVSKRLIKKNTNAREGKFMNHTRLLTATNRNKHDNSVPASDTSSVMTSSSSHESTSPVKTMPTRKARLSSRYINYYEKSLPSMPKRRRKNTV
jgi:hypothetical protein